MLTDADRRVLSPLFWNRGKPSQPQRETRSGVPAVRWADLVPGDLARLGDGVRDVARPSEGVCGGHQTADLSQYDVQVQAGGRRRLQPPEREASDFDRTVFHLAEQPEPTLVRYGEIP
ncbi:hypothetical protein [Streptomyces sp. NPDC088726]|uniref:hypothetical protein n=1 Tax=Streptomyces sp. NPDC088726 TaxID=3365874 RepID=UPI00381AF7F9